MLYELAIMTTRHGAEYALKTNRRDQLIEWIKGLLAVPFVLNSQSTAAYAEGDEVKFLASMAETLHCRYAEIMRDIEVSPVLSKDGGIEMSNPNPDRNWQDGIRTRFNQPPSSRCSCQQSLLSSHHSTSKQHS